jgi:hypothetical protein
MTRFLNYFRRDASVVAAKNHVIRLPSIQFSVQINATDTHPEFRRR